MTGLLTLNVNPALDVQGTISNTSSTSGGDVGFSENIRGTATGASWVLSSSITAAAATTTVPAVRILPVNALDATDLIFQVATSASANLLSVDNNGLTVIAGGATISGAAVNLNASSNFAVNIGTGTSTGAVGIGNSANAVTIAGIISGASPLVFDGATVDALNRTTLAVTDPTAARTITLPDATITVNAAANISGTTLASNVVASSLTSVGTLTALTVSGAGKFTSSTTVGACTLNGGSPSTCTATVNSGTTCICGSGGTTAAIAAQGCATTLSGGTLTLTSANGATNVVGYTCF